MWSDKLAAECQRLGVLDRLITSHPKFLLDKRVATERVEWIAWHFLAHRIWTALRLSAIGEERLKRMFDDLIARKLRYSSPDVFVGWSGYSLNSLRVAREQKIIGVIERGSTHTRVHMDLLLEEQRRWRMSFNTAFWNRVLEREALEFDAASAIFVPSQFVLDSFLSQGFPREKLFKIPYGVDVNRFRPGAARLNRNVFRVVCVGIVTLRKGQQYLAEAVLQLRRRNPVRKIELWLVGPVQADAAPFLRKYSDVITFVGRKSPAEIHTLLQQSDVMVLASVEEGLARAILEAMAVGLPVIVTPNTGGDDVIIDGTNGIIVPIRDSLAITDRLQELLDSPDLRESMGIQARTTVVEGFTWAHYGARTVEAYKALVAAV